MKEGALTPEKQGETPTMYARMLDKRMGNIDWTKSAVEIERADPRVEFLAKCIYLLGK